MPYPRLRETCCEQLRGRILVFEARVRVHVEESLAQIPESAYRSPDVDKHV
jgi:hypothetical protein